MRDLILKHRIQKPGVIRKSTNTLAQSKSPLLILLHEVGGSEDSLFNLAGQFDERFLIVSARGPVVQSPTSFAWYRIPPFVENAQPFVDDPEESRRMLIQFIHETVAAYDVDPHRVFLLGFGQGATLALSLLLTEPGLLCGVAAISGEILPEVLFLRASHASLTDFPVFLAYGIHDQTLPIQSGRKTRDLLYTFTQNINYREYPIGHYLSPSGLQHAAEWLTNRLNLSRRSWFVDGRPRMHLGHLRIKVRDIDRSIAFYKRFLGMRLTERVGKGIAFLSSSYQHHDLALQHAGPDAVDIPPDSLGLVNFAFEITDLVTFAGIFRDLTAASIPVRTVDHLISWSIYFSDPDSHEIELYCDTRDLPGRSDVWQGRDLPLEPAKILAILKPSGESPSPVYDQENPLS